MQIDVARGVLVILCSVVLAVTIAAAPGKQAVKVQLNAVDASGISGMAFLTPRGTDLMVDIVLSGVKNSSSAHYAHLHRGTCEHIESPTIYVLQLVRDGRSTTRLKNIGLQTLIHGTYSVLIHAGASAGSRHVACGTISGA